ncbi:hypothetical protein [Pleurocapsa sp. PCC 7319]|uniref:hypothetical protein n=1 Tax=Pleurocapsa sp. PCC 7319 TaxID=118161 RepID=UPI000345FF1E|nr:hypothetical protein [Pleurocapsa sp. PCC 7319]
MANPSDQEKTTPTADGGKQTPVNPSERKTGQGTSQDTRSGAEPEAPGSKNTDTPGDPNQGTEAR